MTFIEKTIIAVIIFTVLGLLILSPLYAYKTVDNVTCKVADKERITKKESSKYLIFCENEVLENTDSLWYWKWNSSDIYGKIKKGEEYNFKVYGWRIPFLSMSRNIINSSK